MSPMTSALIEYWHRLPAESPSLRRESLDALGARVRAGSELPAVLVPYALGDVDEGIVAEATHAFVRATGAVAEAVEWVRRGLALNRGAVFGALLSLDDGQALERLAALRLVLSAAEVEAACRVLGDLRGERVRKFASDWLELIADGPLQRERRALFALLAPEDCARAA